MEDAIRQDMTNVSYSFENSTIIGNDEELMERFQQSQQNRLNLNKTNGEARFSFKLVPPPRKTRLLNEKPVSGSVLREARWQHSTDKSSSESSESEEDIVQPRAPGGRRSVMQITSDNEEETQFNFKRTESTTLLE